MNKTFTGKFSAALACVAALFSVALVAGCMPAVEQQPSAAAQHRAYMASVNNICAQAADDLDGFSTAVASNDLASMRVSANTAAATLGQIEDLTVPEDMADVHAEYLAGAQELSAALQDYVALYGRYANATYETAEEQALAEQEFAEELADVQALYDSGIGHFATADSMVAELSDGSDGTSAEGSLGTAAESSIGAAPDGSNGGSNE